ncbi:PP2C-family Ser/Thr phosphatase [Klebsiella quasipneumoniae]|uniref:Protein phosphatase n=1 Tax=Kluyvera genomosp. 2 TaxID=2774054 RepID=A0A2T2Y4Y2_9ENTR|nr:MULTISPECIES: protein phosphatase 2C domain-containing protein [Enterobacteriaceae]EIH8470876.1 protein phosphatase 2C domain-containing protein [Escherichia coli]MCS5771174.1 protein phosphatase 2C domain-containing protein [Klebsiella variicola subsp. variicola]DAW01527.1 MAG TPA: Serine/threonine protein phosphatase [Caudoviricetes sp.]HAT3917801.1 serine/threonine-protein phosphatase [Kluyvera ascorbata]HBS1000372.1 protein phosphatase 2C domain-containing protein [Klebsiella quasipneum
MTTIYSCSSFSFPKSLDTISQDSILLPKKLDGGYIFSVADGVGGYNGGKEASNLAIKEISKLQHKVKPSDIDRIFNSIKDSISAFSENNEEYSSAATTLTFGYVSDEGLLIGHSGDCRLYIKEGSKLKQYTKDHTQHQILIDKGLFTARQLRKLQGGNVLTTAISSKVTLEFQSIFIKKEDLPIENNLLTIYLMSDGAHYYWEDRPRFSLNTLNNVNRFSASLMRRIESKGPHDDYSLIGLNIHFENESTISPDAH